MKNFISFIMFFLTLTIYNLVVRYHFYEDGIEFLFMWACWMAGYRKDIFSSIKFKL